MGQSPSGEMCNVIGDGLPLLNGPTEFGSHHPAPVQFTTDGRKIARPGDLLFCVRGSTTGRMNWADQQYAIGRGIAAIRHKKSAELQPFIRAVVESNLLSLLQAATGSTFPNVSASQLSGLTVPDLSEDTQKQIASLLGALDDKIDKNRRMNETLEATARLFFKDWFVEFCPTRAKAEGRPPYLAPELWSLFPDALDDDDKPMGWHLTDVASVTSELRRGISPKYIDEGGVCVLNQKCIRDRAVSFAKARRHDHSAKNIIGREIIEGDILVNSTGVGTLGRVAQIWTVDEPTVADSHVTIVRANNSKVSARYLGMNITGRESEIENLGEGSTGQTELSRTRLGAMDILLPDRIILTAFDETVGPLIELAVKNQSESYTLTQTRDLLLPKLMSGEIRLREAEKIVDNRL